MKTYEVGNSVWVDGYTSIAQQNFRKSTIQEVDNVFDSKTGEPFNIYKVDSEWYDGRDGSAYLNEQSMYYIEFIERYSIPIFENGVDTGFKIEGEVGDENFQKLLTITGENRLPNAVSVNLSEGIKNRLGNNEN